MMIQKNYNPYDQVLSYCTVNALMPLKETSPFWKEHSITQTANNKRGTTNPHGTLILTVFNLLRTLWKVI